MNSFFFCILVLTFFGCLESQRLDKRKPESQPWPSASARARLRNKLRMKSYVDSEQARCPFPTTSCSITPFNTTSSSQPQVLNGTASSLNSTASWTNSTASPSNATVSWECIDLQQELSACGACDNDCTAMPNVESVGCQLGSCKIFTCKLGYTWSEVLDEDNGEISARCV